MLTIDVRGFVGIDAAQVSVDPIALLCGRNKQGKSSIAMATGAALCNEPLVRDLTGKRNASQVVRRGHGSAKATLTSPTGSVSISWPDCKFQQTGVKPPTGSRVAAGLDDICKMPQRERAKYLTEMLGALPTKDDVKTELADMNLPASSIDALWEMIVGGGWDHTHSTIAKRGIAWKAQWEEITGEDYGPIKAETWFPPGWDPDLEGASLDSLSATAEDSRALLESELKKAAVSKHERERLEQMVAEKGAVDANLAVVLAEGRQAKVDLEAAQKTRAELPPAATTESHIGCPHCGQPVVPRMVRGQIMLAKAEDQPALDPAVIAQRREDIRIAESQIQDFESKLAEARRKYHILEDQLLKIASAEEALKQIQALPPASDEAVIDAARNAHEHAKVRVAAFTRRRDAANKHGLVVSNQRIIDMLKPEGLRQAKLSRVLMKLNDTYLKPLSAAWGASPVMIDGDMYIWLGVTPYHLCSRSEKFAVSTIIQLAISMLDGSSMVVIDDADALDPPSRSSVLKAVMTAKLPALICCAIGTPQQAPVLQKTGAGITYWAHDATADPVDKIDISAMT